MLTNQHAPIMEMHSGIGINLGGFKMDISDSRTMTDVYSELYSIRVRLELQEELLNQLILVNQPWWRRLGRFLRKLFT